MKIFYYGSKFKIKTKKNFWRGGERGVSVCVWGWGGGGGWSK